MSEYHGQKYVEGQTAENVPEMPDDFSLQADSADSATDAISVYPRIRFTGRYADNPTGLGCNGFQEFEKYNKTHEEAKQIAYNFFGYCSKTITYFDAGGNVVFQET